MRTEKSVRHQSHWAQLEVRAEFERILKSQEIVVHQPQTDKRDRARRRHQQSQDRASLTPGLHYRHQQD